MSTEMNQNLKFHEINGFLASNEIFLDLIFNDKCNCNCKFCIAKTKDYSIENFSRWKINLKKTFNIFDIKNIIILGGESTIDPLFFEKVDYLTNVIKDKDVDNVILTTNGIMLRNKIFLEKVLNSRINSINLSYMHYNHDTNNKIMGGNTLTKEELFIVYKTVKSYNKTMRLNANVYKGNLDKTEELLKYIEEMSGTCDIIKFSPLMKTDMFDTVEEVRLFSNLVSIDNDKIEILYNDLVKNTNLIKENNNVLNGINYKELEYKNQHVILKYAQVEDTYDLEKVIPTLKLYNNGNLANEWNYKKNILDYFD